MEFTPLTQIKPLDFTNTESTSKVTGTDNVEVPFENVFSEVINAVNATDSVTTTDAFNLAQGDADDLHNLIINSTKAGIAVDMMVALRNRALDAYNEIMRLGV